MAVSNDDERATGGSHASHVRQATSFVIEAKAAIGRIVDCCHLGKLRQQSKTRELRNRLPTTMHGVEGVNRPNGDTCRHEGKQMQRRRLWATTMSLGLFACMFAHATMVQQLNLGELTARADKIFRGTVIRTENGTVVAGGGELPTVKYVIRVSETLKGDTSTGNGKAGNVVELTMLGTLKSSGASGNIRHISTFRPPKLRIGDEYLLFTTAPSNLGLSITVGIGQGAFSFVQGNNVINEAKNAGLFRDMDNQGLPQRGPIPYPALAQRIHSLIGN
jgi:hypothetical protein